MPLPFKNKKKYERRKPDVMTAILATIAAIFHLLLAGLSLAGSAVIFIASMPLFVIFSPVLVPAGIASSLLAVTLAAAGGSSASAVEIIKKLIEKLIEHVKKAERAKMSGGGSASPGASAEKPAEKSDATKSGGDKKPEGDKKPAAKPGG